MEGEGLIGYGVVGGSVARCNMVEMSMYVLEVVYLYIREGRLEGLF